MKKNKYITIDELEDKYFGVKGTPDRDKYELELNFDISDDIGDDSFLSDIKKLENDLLMTINGSVLGSYSKKDIEKRLSNTLTQLGKLRNFNAY